jgi:chromosome segregation ATPase
MIIRVPISAGELIDKITILDIKKKFVKEKSGLKAVQIELRLLNKELEKVSKNFPKESKKIKSYKKNLRAVNLKLWNTENKIRKFESKKIFENSFVQAARQVYRLNDRRAEIKKSINELVGSKISEIKMYSKY